jgi:DNA modification methylase
MTNRPPRPARALHESARPFRRSADVLEQQIILRAPDSLRKNPRNARTHSRRQIRQLANSIKAAGFIGAIVTDETGMVLAGHARLEACKLLEMNFVPTLKVTGLSETQRRAFALADNKIAENAGWDREKLTLELGELAELLPTLNWDLSLTGFEPAEVDLLLADHGEPKPDPADILPPLEPNVVTRPGDLWCAGRNRVLCGDARSQANLHRLMRGTRARMAFLDPPYNVRVADVQGRGRVKHPEFALASGDMSEDEYVNFLREALANAARVSMDGAVHFVCNDWRHVCELIIAGRPIYGAMLNIVVWAKTNAGQGSFYRSGHEFIVVFRVGRAHHQNNIELGRFGRNRSNLWTYAGINTFGPGRMEMLAMHPTVKPVTLVADAMRDCTSKGDVVLDSFLGSGTTILAAEKIGRRGCGLEIEPRYVDVAIQRWEAFTKSDAVLEDDGRTFADVRTERLNLQDDSNAQSVILRDKHKDDGRSADLESCDEGDWVGLCEAVPLMSSTGGDK